MKNIILKVDNIKSELEYLNHFRYSVINSNTKEVIFKDSIDDIGQSDEEAVAQIKKLIRYRYTQYL